MTFKTQTTKVVKQIKQAVLHTPGPFSDLFDFSGQYIRMGGSDFRLEFEYCIRQQNLGIL